MVINTLTIDFSLENIESIRAISYHIPFHFVRLLTLCVDGVDL